MSLKHFILHIKTQKRHPYMSLQTPHLQKSSHQFPEVSTFWKTQGCYWVVFLTERPFLLTATLLEFLHWKVKLELSLQKSARSGRWILTLFPLPTSS